jgi:phosphotransacetylase
MRISKLIARVLCAVAIVWAADESTQYAAIRALNDGFIDAIFVGCREQLEQLAELKPHAEHITYVDTDDKDKAAALAVQMVREGQADVLMKGLINTHLEGIRLDAKIRSVYLDYYLSGILELYFQWYRHEHDLSLDEIKEFALGIMETDQTYFLDSYQKPGRP